jgi:hypothetical protein
MKNSAWQGRREKGEIFPESPNSESWLICIRRQIRNWGFGIAVGDSDWDWRFAIRNSGLTIRDQGLGASRRGAAPACGRATTRHTSGLEDYRKCCAVEVMEGRETVGVTVVAPDVSNEHVTIEAPAGGNAALTISGDAIVPARRILLTTPPSILPLRANCLSNWRALVGAVGNVRISLEFCVTHLSDRRQRLSDRLAA